MLRRTAGALFEAARAQAALSSKGATLGALFDLNVSTLATRVTTSSASTSSSSFAAAASSSPLRRSRSRFYWNDGYQRFGDQQRGGGRRGRGNQQQRDPRSTFRAKPRLVSLLGGATLAAGGAVYYGNMEEVPYTLRKHSILVSKELEISLGESTFAQIVQEARATRRLLPPHHPSVRAVERIGRRLAAVASDSGGGGSSKHMEGLRWEFIVVDDPGNVNAMVAPGKEVFFFCSFPFLLLSFFCVSLHSLSLSLFLSLAQTKKTKQNSFLGGKVVVYTGLLRILTSEKELAAVLAHEVAHILARHTAEKLTSMQAAGLAR